MSVRDAVESITVKLKGQKQTKSDVSALREKLPPGVLPQWLQDTLIEYPLAGVEFTLTEDVDLSGVGAIMCWFNTQQIQSEALAFEPGLSVVSLGFLPIAGCAEGSGDPYFLDLRNEPIDPPVVRILHDFAVVKPYPTDKIQIVAVSLSSLFLAGLSGRYPGGIV